jgi:hypothetical protein
MDKMRDPYIIGGICVGKRPLESPKNRCIRENGLKVSERKIEVRYN